MLGIRTRTRTTTVPGRGPRHDRPARTVIVGLPPHTEARRLAEVATARLAATGMAVRGTMPHFTAGTRRSSRLVDCSKGITSGGPIGLLDLDATRHHAAAAAAAQWQLWYQVTADTRPAQPLWLFVDRSRHDPDRYPLDRVREEYLAQPRLLAMHTYNALPHRVCDLPVEHLEAFQTGYGTYTNLGWLAAVAADAVLPDGGGWLTATTNRVADQLDYLKAANEHLADLDPDAPVVAMAIDS